MKKRKFRTIFWAILAVIVLAVAFFIVKDMILRSIYPLEYKAEISGYAEQYKLDPYFVASVIWAESGYRDEAVSRKGAIGLMQIMPDTGEWIAGKLKMKDYKEEKLNEPKTNIRFGCWYLRYIMDKLGDDEIIVLSAYNAGPGRVEKWLGDKNVSKDGKSLDVIPFDETRKYVEKIKRAYEVYKQLYQFKE